MSKFKPDYEVGSRPPFALSEFSFFILFLIIKMGIIAYFKIKARD